MAKLHEQKVKFVFDAEQRLNKNWSWSQNVFVALLLLSDTRSVHLHLSGRSQDQVWQQCRRIMLVLMPLSRKYRTALLTHDLFYFKKQLLFFDAEQNDYILPRDFSKIPAGVRFAHIYGYTEEIWTHAFFNQSSSHFCGETRPCHSPTAVQ